MRILGATMTRRSRSGDNIGPAQRADVMIAFHAMTIWPARQIGEEDRKRSIEVGDLADFVVPSDDPGAVDPEGLTRIEALPTIKDGPVAFEADWTSCKTPPMSCKKCENRACELARTCKIAAQAGASIRPRGRPPRRWRW
jgi:hypothetical protein